MGEGFGEVIHRSDEIGAKSKVGKREAGRVATGLLKLCPKVKRVIERERRPERLFEVGSKGEVGDGLKKSASTLYCFDLAERISFKCKVACLPACIIM